MGSDKGDKSLARSLGEFVGLIWKGVRADVGPQKRTTRHEVEQEQRDTPEGRVTLRRTTIEEIEVDPDRPRDQKTEP